MASTPTSSSSDYFNFYRNAGAGERHDERLSTVRYDFVYLRESTALSRMIAQKPCVYPNNISERSLDVDVGDDDDDGSGTSEFVVALSAAIISEKTWFETRNTQTHSCTDKTERYWMWRPGERKRTLVNRTVSFALIPFFISSLDFSFFLRLPAFFFHFSSLLPLQLLLFVFVSVSRCFVRFAVYVVCAVHCTDTVHVCQYFLTHTLSHFDTHNISDLLVATATTTAVIHIFSPHQVLLGYRKQKIIRT